MRRIDQSLERQKRQRCLATTTTGVAAAGAAEVPPAAGGSPQPGPAAAAAGSATGLPSEDAAPVSEAWRAAADEKALLWEALDSGSDDEAAGKLQALRRRFPANPHFPLAEGRLAARRGNADGARALFTAAVALAEASGPRDASVVLHAWATFEGDRGRLQEARALLRRAVAADPRHAAAHCSLGRLAEAHGDVPAAAAHYSAALAAEPKHAPSLQALALLAARQGRFAKAREIFQRALGDLPDNAPLYAAWGNMEWKLGR